MIETCSKGLFKPIDALFLQIPKKHLETDSSLYRKEIIQRSGREILSELQKTPILTPGECILTSGYRFPNTKYFIHIALPKYSMAFPEASISAVHLGIRNAIDICIENGFSTIILGKDIFKPQANFPVKDCVEVILRTFRSCLENVNNEINKIIFCIDNDEIFKVVYFYMTVFFPRNSEELERTKNFVKSFHLNKYGDIILPKRCLSKIRKEINFNGSIKNTGEDKWLSFNEVGMIDFDEIENNFNDEEIVKETFNEEIEFSKYFYYKSMRNLDDNIENKFEDLNIISYKGYISNRQIYFFHLRTINFSKLEKYNLLEEFVLFLYKYFQKNYEINKKISLIIFCRDINKDNYPTKSFIDIVQKIVLSVSTLQTINFDNIDINFMMPDFLFKCYFKVIQVIIKDYILDRVSTYENYDELNSTFNYSLNLDENIEKIITTILLKFGTIYEEIAEIKEKRFEQDKYKKIRYKNYDNFFKEDNN